MSNIRIIDDPRLLRDLLIVNAELRAPTVPGNRVEHCAQIGTLNGHHVIADLGSRRVRFFDGSQNVEVDPRDERIRHFVTDNLFRY